MRRADSSGSVFRSAMFDAEPEKPAEPAKGSLFGLPSFGELPRFSPPPMAKSGGSLLPPLEPKPSPAAAKPAPSPAAAKPSPAIPAKPAVAAPTAKPLAAPALRPPLATPGVPPLAAPIKPPLAAPAATPPIPVPAPTTAAPALDEGWGDLDDLLAPPTPKSD